MNSRRLPQRRGKSLVAQLLRLVVPIGGAMVVLVPLVLFVVHWDQARRFSERTAEEIASVAARNARYAVLIGSSGEAESALTPLLGFPDVTSIYLADIHGKVLADLHDPSKPSLGPEHVAEMPVTSAKGTLPNDASLLVKGKGKGKGHDIVGVVRVTLSLDRADDLSTRTAVSSGILIGLLMIALGAALTRRTIRILAPLTALADFLRQQPDPHAGQPPLTHSAPAEIRDIDDAVAKMREHIGSVTDNLEEMVATRTRDAEVARAAAERANQAKTIFLANVSHELRTPLQAILLHASELSTFNGHTGPTGCQGVDGDNRVAPLPHDRAESVTAILRSSSQLYDFIETLLNLSRADAGHPLEVSLEPFSLTRLVEHAAATLRPTLSHDNQLLVLVPDDDIQMVSDRTRITQVINNLVRNADKFSLSSGIRLEVAQRDPQSICIDVIDYGVGIPTDVLPKIFEPFFQVQGSQNNGVPSGIGMGLSLTRTIVEALGGTVAVRSEVGVGSHFSITLPVAPHEIATEIEAKLPARAETRDPTAATSLRMGTRVLLAEDEALIREPIVRLLRKGGCEVTECVDGTSALAELSGDQRFNAVILDHRMPGCQGLEVLRRMRVEFARREPVVILTGNERAEISSQCKELRATLLIKPVKPATLLGIVSSLIEESTANPLAPSFRSGGR